jgi:hypothetical protein
MIYEKADKAMKLLRVKRKHAERFTLNSLCAALSLRVSLVDKEQHGDTEQQRKTN